MTINKKKLSKKQLEPDNFFYFSLPLRSSVTNLKSTRFFLWMALAQIIFIPFYIGDKYELIPLTGPLLMVYLFLGFISFFSLITMLLFKTRIYEPLVYLMAGIFLLDLAFLFVITVYIDFFDSHNAMEVFNTLNESVIEEEKIIMLNRLLLIPPITFVLSFIFHIYAIKTGRISKQYKKAQKFEENSRNFNNLLPTLVPAMFIVGVLTINSNVFQGGFMSIILILGTMILSGLAPTIMVVAYMKRKFPEVYLEKNIHK